jgi:hypothetical protein
MAGNIVPSDGLRWIPLAFGAFRRVGSFWELEEHMRREIDVAACYGGATAADTHERLRPTLWRKSGNINASRHHRRRDMASAAGGKPLATPGFV